MASSIAGDADEENFYVAVVEERCSIGQINMANKKASIVAGSWVCSTGIDSAIAAAASASIGLVSGIAVDSGRNIYLADHFLVLVFVVGGMLQILTGQRSGLGVAVEGAASSSALGLVSAPYMDVKSNVLYVAD